VTIDVGKPSAIGQLTRPTQPFILSGSINEYSKLQLDVRCLSCCGCDILVNAHEGKAGMVLFAGKTVRCMPERFECTTSAKKALYKYSSFPFISERERSRSLYAIARPSVVCRL